MLDNNGAHIADSLAYKDEVIRRDYREAKNKPEQVKILADLNDCGTNEIRQVLGMKTIGRKPGCGLNEKEVTDEEEAQTPRRDRETGRDAAGGTGRSN